MAQNKTTIRSGNQTLRAYDDEGVLTPASGLDEYTYIIIDQQLTGGTFYEFPLNNNTPLLVTTVAFDVVSSNSTAFLAFGSRVIGNDLFKFPIVTDQAQVTGNGGYAYREMNYLIPNDDTLLIKIDALEVQYLRILCKRVSQQTSLIPTAN